MFGAAMLLLPARVQDVSPFTHTPKLPGADFAAAPIFGLIVIAVILVVACSGSTRRWVQRPANGSL
jgi:ABC-2 type transport system permease protein